MFPSLDPDILKYLTAGENIRLAFEIARYAPQLKPQLLNEFWHDLHSAILNAVPVGRSADEFCFRAPTATDDPYAQFRAIPVNATNQPRQLAFTIEQESTANNYDLYVGLHWNLEFPPSSPLHEQPPLLELKQQFDAGGSDFSNPWWVGGRYVRRFESLEEFVSTFAEDRAAIIDPVTIAFWDVVENHFVGVNQVNQAVATV